MVNYEIMQGDSELDLCLSLCLLFTFFRLIEIVGILPKSKVINRHLTCTCDEQVESTGMRVEILD